MQQFILTLSVFIISHLLPSLPGVRAHIIQVTGRRAYFIGYGVVSSVLLIWTLYAALSAPVTLLWMPSGWQAHVTLVLSPLGLFLVVAGLITPNPLSLSARRDDRVYTGGIVAVTRHPVFWGGALWSGSHIPPNGDVRSVLLFGTLTLLAVAGFWLSDRRARNRLGTRWAPLARTTSIFPFAAIACGRTRFSWDRSLTLSVIVCSVLTVWLLWGGHSALIGADPLAATRY